MPAKYIPLVCIKTRLPPYRAVTSQYPSCSSFIVIGLIIMNFTVQLSHGLTFYTVDLLCPNPPGPGVLAKHLHDYLLRILNLIWIRNQSGVLAFPNVRSPYSHRRAWRLLWRHCSIWREARFDTYKGNIPGWHLINRYLHTLVPYMYLLGTPWGT